MIYGYARVSTDGQSVDAQVKAASRRRSRKSFPRNGERREIRPGQLRRALDSSTRATC